MDPMQQIWEKLVTTDVQGEKSVTYKNAQDLIYLYANGFVDADKYTLEEWLKAFTDSEQKDGSYRLTYSQWMAKKKYRYAGPVEPPFDPSRMKEEVYNESEFIALLKSFIVPSTWLSEKSIPKVIKNYEAAGKFKDGKILIDKFIKEDFAKMLRFYPSPLRMLQLSVYGKRKAVGTATTEVSAYQQTADQGKDAAKRLEALFQSPIQGKIPTTVEPSQTGTATLKEMMKKQRTTPGRV